MRRAQKWVVLVALPVVLAACGGGEETTSTAGAGGNGGGTPGVACEGAPADLTLAGTWAASARLAVTLVGLPGGAITICPADQVGESRLLMLVTMQQPSGTELAQVQGVVCSIELPVVTALVGNCDPMSQSLVSTQIIAPQKLIDALPTIASAPVTGTLSGTSPSSTMTLDRFVVTVGTSATGDMKPTWDTVTPACNDTMLGRTSQCESTCVSDCMTMRDDDTDMNPGVTVNVCGKTPDDEQNGVQCQFDAPNQPGTALQGHAFIHLTVDPQIGGTVKSSCEVTGTVDSGVDYSIVGGDIYLAGAPISVASAIKSLPSFQVDASQSNFRMVRIDGQYGAPDFQVDAANPQAACAQIIQRQNEL